MIKLYLLTLLVGKKDKGKEKKHKNKAGKKVKEKKEEKEEKDDKEEKPEHVQFEENPQILPIEPLLRVSEFIKFDLFLTHSVRFTSCGDSPLALLKHVISSEDIRNGRQCLKL